MTRKDVEAWFKVQAALGDRRLFVMDFDKGQRQVEIEDDKWNKSWLDLDDLCKLLNARRK